MSKSTLTAQLPPVRLAKDEREQLQTLADADSRTLSNYIRNVLLKHLNFVKDNHHTVPKDSFDSDNTMSTEEWNRQYEGEFKTDPVINTSKPTGVNEILQVTAEETPNDNKHASNPATGWSTGEPDTGEPSY